MGIRGSGSLGADRVSPYLLAPSSRHDRLTVLILAITFCAGFTACTEGESASPSTPTVPSAPSVPSTESPPRVEWTVADRCVDGHFTEWRLFHFPSGNIVETWPSSSSRVYRAATGEDPSTVTITPHQPELGGQICMGAEAGNNYWGVGLDGNRSCEACCVSVPRAGTVTKSSRLVC